ncbi:MAG: cysteine dioxygenase family protein [Acidimicrobiales bacterium]|jgi:hypothetical protein
MTIAPNRSVRPRIRPPIRPVADPIDLLSIAQGFARSAASWPDVHDPTERCWRTIAATDRFEAFVIAWPVGGAIALHDHGDSAGAVVVASGALVETAVSSDRDGALVVTSASVPTGGYIAFDPGYVHDLVNHGPGPSISVHVYSPVLETMTFFDGADGDVLVPVRTETFRAGRSEP